MSFITKRERVFNEYDLFDLPARNEGKLKAYASCTDARAWSHFCSDKTEHLVEIIKRNNETCRPKYVPTDVIVDTLMVAKNAEITRLRRKIEEFEQMLAAYDQLELSSEQKEEIAKAHAAIKAANKELDELCLDLDLSGFTEGVDSEAFETGKSSGDEPSRYRSSETPMISPKSYETRTIDSESPNVESTGVQMDVTCSCDASTNVVDKRIDEMQDCILTKDAKLNAMKNTIAVLDNDVSEPYYVYAHIYTALAKIFAILRQNDKYKQYLNLLTAGKDIRCINIKGKILYKLMVLEKFSLALIAPCTQDFSSVPMSDCACFHVEIESAFALTSSESTQRASVDNKRAHLVADIIENDEMKEILSRDDSSIKEDEDQVDFCSETDPYSIDTENLKRLKNLQANYDDLLSCYENVINEKDCLQLQCNKYVGLENELESLKRQLREYNSLWNEKEHYRKRSTDLDSLKEQYLILVDETTNLETQLKAEAEINNIKTKSIDELRDENILLEQKINEATIAFEKEKNTMLCKLKAAECRILCQEEQIKSLSSQIDNLLEQGHEKGREGESQSLTMLNEIETLKEQIRNLKDAMVCNDEEKQELQKLFQEKLDVITQLRNEIEDWKSTYEKILDRNDYLEKYTENICDEMHRLRQENTFLVQDIEEKTAAFENLINVTHNKSQQISNLMNELDTKTAENNNLLSEIEELKNIYCNGIKSLENEKKMAMASLQLAKQESQEILEIVKDDSKMIEKDVIEPSKALLQPNLSNREENNSILLQEIQRLREINNLAVSNIKDMNNERSQYKRALDLSETESGILKEKLSNFEVISQELRNLQRSHESVLSDKNKLENELLDKEINLNKALNSIDLCKKQSDELFEKLQQSESLKNDIIKLNEAYQKVIDEKRILQDELYNKNRELATLLSSYNSLKSENAQLLEKSNKTELLEKALIDLNTAYDTLMLDKTKLQSDYNNKNEMLSKLLKSLENENRNLSQELKKIENDKQSKENIIKSMLNENVSTRSTLEVLKRDSVELIDQIKHYKNMEDEFNQLKIEHDEITAHNEQIQNELNQLQEYLKQLEDQKTVLYNRSQHLLTQSEDLKNELIITKTELIQKSSFTTQSSEEILNEIAQMKKDKFQNQMKIRELRDKLDDSEKKMTDLIEEVTAREDKIAVLENHINALQDEVQRLQIDLSGAVDVGEQIKDLSIRKIDDSLKSMQAHHSKATHNIKMEVAKLQHQNENLETQLSSTKILSEKCSFENQKYKSQLMKLQTEREIIVTDIKQIELQCVGDTILAPDNCGIEEVLASLHRIRKAFDERHLKSITLEQTLLKVQTSSELLINKTEEAKKIVEKEKLKTVNEKEDIVKDKQNMENQLRELKEKLQKQASDDKVIIKDLEAEIQNQKLIIEKINKTTHEYINKLKEEMQSLRLLYEDSISKVGELQQQLETAAKGNNELLEVVNKAKSDLEVKSKEIENLQIELDTMRKKTDFRSIGCQAKSFIVESVTTQTDIALEYKDLGNLEKKDDETRTKKGIEENFSLLHVNKIHRSKNIFETDQTQKPQPLNEVQVLRAKVDPTFDFVRNSYLNYKIQQLSTGKLEQYSYISNNNLNGSQVFIDIYNKEIDRAHTSTAGLSSNDKTTKYGIVNNSESSDGTSKNDQNNRSSISTVTKSQEKDLVVIYKDSESSENVIHSGNEEMMSQFPDINSTNLELQNRPIKDNKLQQRNNKTYTYSEGVYDDKPKMYINVPRADLASSSVLSLSATEKKSLDSQLTEIHTISKRFLTTDLSNQTAAELFRIHSPSIHTASNADCYSFSNVMQNQSESMHELLRVNAESLLIKDNNEETTQNSDKLNVENSQRLKLNNKDVKYSRQSTSDKKYSKQNNKFKKLDEILFADIKSSSDNSKKRIITNQYKPASSTSKLTEINSEKRDKVLIDRDVMVNLNGTHEYEVKINQLTEAMNTMEKDFKKKIEAIKVQYDRHIKTIINDHNEGVKSLQFLHEETLHDIFKVHENEVESLRSMSMEAMRKVDKLEKENRSLKTKTYASSSMCLDEEPTKMSPVEVKKRRRTRGEKTLTKTEVDAFNVKPKRKTHGPCTCSLDINLSDTIRNIFERVDVEHRELVEQTYMKHIANKMINGNIEVLDAAELSFLHLKVCRMWKSKVNKEEALQKKIGTLENELMEKQRHAQQHIAELDRKVAEERRRLEEVREAMHLGESVESRVAKEAILVGTSEEIAISDAEKEMHPCSCTSRTGFKVSDRRSAGDVAADMANVGLRPRRQPNDTSRAVLARLDGSDRREKKMYTDEQPTRLRKMHEKPRALKK